MGKSPVWGRTGNVRTVAPNVSRSLLSANLPLFSRRLQLPIPLSVNLRLTPGEHVLRGDVANRAVQANVVVMLDVALHQTLNPFDPISFGKTSEGKLTDCVAGLFFDTRRGGS